MELKDKLRRWAFGAVIKLILKDLMPITVPGLHPGCTLHSSFLLMYAWETSNNTTKSLSPYQWFVSSLQHRPAVPVANIQGVKQQRRPLYISSCLFAFQIKSKWSIWWHSSLTRLAMSASRMGPGSSFGCSISNLAPY